MCSKENAAVFRTVLKKCWIRLRNVAGFLTLSDTLSLLLLLLLLLLRYTGLEVAVHVPVSRSLTVKQCVLWANVAAAVAIAGQQSACVLKPTPAGPCSCSSVGQSSKHAADVETVGTAPTSV
jgi:hypothetical protein